jgi:hypothetical protein
MPSWMVVARTSLNHIEKELSGSSCLARFMTRAHVCSAVCSEGAASIAIHNLFPHMWKTCGEGRRPRAGNASGPPWVSAPHYSTELFHRRGQGGAFG